MALEQVELLGTKVVPVLRREIEPRRDLSQALRAGRQADSQRQEASPGRLR
jgi:hypothetical protein